MFVNIVQFPPLAAGKEREFEEWFAWSNALYEHAAAALLRSRARNPDP